MHCKLSSILALTVFTYNCDVFLFLCTLDRFPGGDRMKALHFHEIFMFALRWHQAESVVRFVAAELFFKSGTILFGSTSGQGERFQYLRQNMKINNITIENIIMTTKWTKILIKTIKTD